MHFTIDVDWAPEEVIQDTIDLFNVYDTACTFFATHRSEVLLGCDTDKFEIGLHPNFNYLVQGKGGAPNIILENLIKIYPKAKGIRSHSLTQNQWLLGKFKEKGMLYELNHFLPYQKCLKPFMLWCGLLRIPFNWEDDYHFLLNHSFEDSRINDHKTNFNIFNFHPIHIYLNSENNDRFLAVKSNMADIDMLQRHQNKGPVKGTRDILIKLLEYSANHPSCSLRMIDIYEGFLDGKYQEDVEQASSLHATK